MAADPRKRQKKLEKRNARRKAKHHELAREKAVGLPERLTAAASYPILDCFATNPLWSQGMGVVVLTRLMPNGMVALADFLVDRYCLGIKDAFGRIVGRSEYDHRFVAELRSQFGITPLTPETARHFVESAVAYARNLGFEPHPDYHRAKLLFGDLDPSKATQDLEFGQDGKPLYIAGPHDDVHRQQQILSTLARTVGPQNAPFIVPHSPYGPSPFGGPDSFDDDWDDV